MLLLHLFVQSCICSNTITGLDALKFQKLWHLRYLRYLDLKFRSSATFCFVEIRTPRRPCKGEIPPPSSSSWAPWGLALGGFPFALVVAPNHRFIHRWYPKASENDPLLPRESGHLSHSNRNPAVRNIGIHSKWFQQLTFLGFWALETM